MTSIPSLAELATSFRRNQLEINQSLDQSLAASPQKLAIEKSAYELNCLIYETLDSARGFWFHGAYVQPSVLAIHNDNERLTGSPLEGRAPFLTLVFPAHNDMAQAIVRALSKLSAHGVVERAALGGESERMEQDMPALQKKFEFRGIPILYTPMTPH